MFQLTLSRTDTVLLEEPLPRYKPLLVTVALLTVMVLLPPAAEPTVIRPLLEKVLALVAPKMFRLLLLPPAVPTMIAPAL